MKFIIKKSLIIFLLPIICSTLFAEELAVGTDKGTKDVKNDHTSVNEIFSVKPLKKKSNNEKKWHFTLGGWFQNQLGNTDKKRAIGSVSFQYNNGITQLKTSYEIFYGESDGHEDENNGQGIIKLDHFIFSRIELFMFSQAEHDNMSSIRFRSNTGAGVKFLFFKNRFWEFSTSGAALYQYENFFRYKFKYEDLERNPFDIYEDYKAGAPAYDIRASFRGRVKIKPVKRLLFMFTYYYIPKMRNFRDYRTKLNAFVQFGLVEFGCMDVTDLKKPWCSGKQGIFLKVGFIRSYNRNAQPGIDRIDDNLYAKVMLKL